MNVLKIGMVLGLVGCGPGYATLKPESIAKVVVGSGQAAVCGLPGQTSALVVTVTTKDGKTLRTAAGKDTEGKLDRATFLYETSVGTIDRNGILTLPTSPLATLSPVIVTVRHPKSDAAKASQQLSIRYDCEVVLDLRGGPGAVGSSTYPTSGSSQGEAPSGYAGSPGGGGGTGGNGAAIDVRAGWFDADHGTRLALVRVSDGQSQWFYLLDPKGPGLGIDVSGGAGGMGGYGQSGAIAGNFADPGTSGGDGGDGGDGGTGGTAKMFLESADLEGLIHVNVDAGPAGEGGPGGAGGPESENAEGTRKLPAGPEGRGGRPGRAGTAGAQPTFSIIASPTEELVAAAGGATAPRSRVQPTSVAPGRPTPPAHPTRPGDHEPRVTTPDPHAPGDAGGTKHPRDPANRIAPMYRGDMTITLTVQKPARAKAVSSTSASTVHVTSVGGKNRLEFGTSCSFDLGPDGGTITKGACDNGPISLSKLTGRVKISPTVVTLDLRGAFAFQPEKKTDKVQSGDVTVHFSGKPI